ncbi:FAD-binding and (Fe-S)-binding domain-containing protein [Nocardioides acrostichi]|uniref:FAD-binding oxidoreductase n=1 Tax=Nocardioides acrostichi TaxID=2784339 RepID=A0A930UTW1_9ACTN|nr:FAD-binding and (Fe-S)-binding domain-containing protein [Nocardioides acrostichi]MBF4160743.1 FAD-binding oxidoreductase [Nocardioides acrostichi]
MSRTAGTAHLAAELRRRGVARVDASRLVRALYSSDASLYRVVPQVVVRAQHVDELVLVHEVSRDLGVPVTLRGAGTSIAGNAVGPGIVIDTRDLRRIAIDPESRTALVEPGVVHADLQRAAAPHGLRFGPDPSTHTRCTIGGMIGNNACGSRALGYGRTVDNVESLTVRFGNGETASLGAAATGSATGSRLVDLAAEHLAHVRTTFGRFGRQVSGYGMEHLLPEKGRRVERFLVGSEGTLATVLEATVRLVADEPGRLLLVLGYDSMAEAADAVPPLLATAGGRMIACEGLDARIVELGRSAGRAVPQLPRGGGWLFAEVAGADASAVADRLRVASGAASHRLVTDPGEAAALWRIREDGAGLAGRSLPTAAHSGWEDAAVPPEHLGAWLRDFEELLADHDLRGYPYGHFGDGCIHCRIDFPFAAGDPASAEVFRRFMTACAERLRLYGGSLSGEHGDGRVRSELLPTVYDATSLALFGAVKGICDPDGLMNPGNIVEPASITENLRPTRPVRAPAVLGLNLLHDGGDLGAAVHRCTGVGKCVSPATSGVMCPSYLATRQEKDSTRGRARVLQEALDGTLVDGLADDAVHDALDLCLACKGCASDCPTGVDMATYKSEALFQKYDAPGATARRPRSHLILGRLPLWARLIQPVAPVANATLALGPVAAVAKRVAGIDQRRGIPRFADVSLQRSTQSASLGQEAPDVWLWADSFTDHFSTGSGHAAIAFLASHGLTVRVISKRACCGLTWITTGQLDRARVLMRESVATLAPYVESGVPVFALEPSCTATLRSDSVELVGPERIEQARTVAAGVLTFAELITRLDLPLPDLRGVDVVAQPHCHQSAVLGWDADRALLERAGARVTRVPGCCGLAGNFGVEQGHYEVSVAVAETHLLPAVRSRPDAVVLADGMSCRIQLHDLAGVPALHLAELFAARADGAHASLSRGPSTRRGG